MPDITLNEQEQKQVEGMVEALEGASTTIQKQASENENLKRALANAKLQQKAASEPQQEILRETIQKLAAANVITPDKAAQQLDAVLADPVGTMAQMLQKVAHSVQSSRVRPAPSTGRPVDAGTENIQKQAADEKESDRFWRESVQKR
jgi:ABC-type transporter Mla subunit MlaD